MDSVAEAIVISDSGSKANFYVYDMKNESLICTFKNGNKCGPKKLSSIGGEYFLCASKDKPEIYAWTATKPKFDHCKMDVPGIVTCLSVNAIGDYCIAGIKHSVFVWEVASGRLMNVLNCHSQPITCLKFSSDGTYVISGARDGYVFVWLFSEIIDLPICDASQPYHSWPGHSAEITDMYVGKLIHRALVATVSLDKTCKVYELETGNLLTSICADVEISAVTMDNAECFLMLGCTDGNIYRVNMFPEKEEVTHVGAKSEFVFVGHSAAITTLSVSTFGKYLLSGSDDGYAMLWNICSLSNVYRKRLEGSITNAFITLLPLGLKNDVTFIPKIPVGNFEREFDEVVPPCITSRVTYQKLSLTHTETPDNYFEEKMLVDCNTQDIISKCKASPQELDAVNKQLYSYALGNLTQMLPSVEAE